MTARTRSAVALSAALALTAALALATEAGARRQSGVRFSPPVKVTPPLGFGYEPTVVVDDFGNIFSTAHKENWQLLLAPDTRSPLLTRSMSWMWTSVDNGRTWHDIPGLTALSLEQREPGIEGDLVIDDANHLYLVDTYLPDSTITRWTLTGRGLDGIQFDFTRPLIPSANPVDDRPWVTAHGDSTVVYLGNDGTKFGDGGRYTVYPSYDGGMTFDPVGQVLPDSGWCRPAADHTPGSQFVYVACTNDAGKLYVYVSDDDARTFTRREIGTYTDHPRESWPTVEVAPDGSVWVLFNDGVPNTNPIRNRLRLFHSTDHGATWTDQDITPVPGLYDYAWLAVSRFRNDLLGMGVYYRPNTSEPWHVYGAIWRPGQVPTLVKADPTPVSSAAFSRPPGDYLGSYFGPDHHLSVVWTRRVLTVGTAASLERDIYFARARALLR
ncbi:MAG TPA: sialidase family protein [Actinomycetota bacterium]|nr:sialidase family protein [Actinomycetota bacterium]